MNNPNCGSIIFSTYCDHRCLFCGPNERVSQKEQRRQELVAYKTLIYFKSEGIKNVDVSGCDPIEYENIIPFLKYLKKQGFWVQLSTNANRLADKDFCRRLLTTELDKIRIPVYGSNAKIHEAITRKEGSFKKLISALNNLISSRKRIEIEMSTLLMEQNKSALINIIKMADSFKVGSFYVGVPCLAGDNTSFYVPFSKAAPYIRKAFDYIKQKEMKYSFVEIPYCVFGKIDPGIKNLSNVPRLSPSFEKSSVHKIIDGVPSYRVKKKAEMCKRCKANSFCDGFFERDINRFGMGNLKPIK